MAAGIHQKGVKNVKGPDELRLLKNADQPKVMFSVSKRRGYPFCQNPEKEHNLITSNCVSVSSMKIIQYNIH